MLTHIVQSTLSFAADLALAFPALLLVQRHSSASACHPEMENVSH
jgi:hypothetical protein